MSSTTPTPAPTHSSASAAGRAGVVLGTMNFGARTPARDAERLVALALERGVTRVDTANLYAGGEAERILGRTLASVAGARDRVHLASKVGAQPTGGAGRGAEGLSHARVLAAVDESLTRLRTERIDLLYLHVPDPAVPIAETLSAIAHLLERGKILAWGASNYAAWQLVELFAAAEAAGIPPPARAQQLYNALVRQLDVEYFPFAARYGLATEVYNPLAGGLLTDRHADVTADRRGSRFWKNSRYERRYWSAPLFARRAELAALAESLGVSLVTLAYRFLLARGVAGVVVGPATAAHLDAALDALTAPLDPPAMAAIDKLHTAWIGTDACYAR
jgi:aryl-alcohol dehydrogenase-like predicted oxidoreductase